jgi:hypothetical protein
MQEEQPKEQGKGTITRLTKKLTRRLYVDADADVNDEHEHDTATALRRACSCLFLRMRRCEQRASVQTGVWKKACPLKTNAL